MPVELRRVTSLDEEIFGRIADDVFDEPIKPDRLRAYLAEPGHLMILALDEGVVVGQCAAVIHRHPDKVTELYLDELGTASTHRRRGIARQLIQAMFDLGRDLGCGESWLGTELDNIAANGLYLAFGGTAEHMAYYEFTL